MFLLTSFAPAHSQCLRSFHTNKCNFFPQTLNIHFKRIQVCIKKIFGQYIHLETQLEILHHFSDHQLGDDHFCSGSQSPAGRVQHLDERYLHVVFFRLLPNPTQLEFRNGHHSQQGLLTVQRRFTGEVVLQSQCFSYQGLQCWLESSIKAAVLPLKNISKTIVSGFTVHF